MVDVAEAFGQFELEEWADRRRTASTEIPPAATSTTAMLTSMAELEPVYGRLPPPPPPPPLPAMSTVVETVTGLPSGSMPLASIV